MVSYEKNYLCKAVTTVVIVLHKSTICHCWKCKYSNVINAHVSLFIWFDFTISGFKYSSVMKFCHTQSQISDVGIQKE